MSETKTPTSTPETQVVPVPPTETKEPKTPEGGEGVTPSPTPTEPAPTPTPDPVPPATPKVEKKEINWKEKFSNSSRRNQIVEAQLKELQKTLGDITKEDIPTDDEMRASDPDWDYRSDFEKNLAVKTEATQRMMRRVHLTVKGFVSEGERASAIALVCENDARLKGKEDDFFHYASDPKNENVAIETLISAFLYEAKETDPDPTNPTPTDPAPQPTAPEAPPALERGNPTGGRPTAPTAKAGEFSPEQLKELRTKNPKEYMRMIRQGIIK